MLPIGNLRSKRVMDHRRMKRNINGRIWDGAREALDALEKSLTGQRNRRELLAREELQGALDVITVYLQSGWSTGGGRRLRQFVWSLWNGHHLINLCDLSSGLDSRLSDAVIVAFQAAMLGALKEDAMRTLLKNSGEFARWEAASARTPEREDVLYPPLAISTDSLRRLAHSAEQNDLGIEQERQVEEVAETRCGAISA